MTNLKQLEYFVSLAETLSFTKTSEKFFISQTAVTQQIKVLENELDVRLLNRTKRHVELTPAGIIFLTEAKAILARTEDAIIKTRKAATGFIGALNLGIVGGYDNPRLPDILRSFHTGYPNVSLSICEAGVGTLYSSLINQTLDVVINACFSYNKLVEKKISYKSISTHNLIIMLPTTHPMAFRNELSMSELKNDAFILTAIKEDKDNFGHYESTMSHFIRSGFTPNTIHHSDNFDITALMVAANMGVAVVPSYTLVTSRNLGNVVTLPLKEKPDQFEIVAARYNENHNPTIDKFLAYMS